MSNTWKIYMLAIISFIVGTSVYVVAGISDKIADSLDVSLTAAGQLVTVFSLAYAICTPIILVLTAKWGRRKLIMYSLGLFVVANILSFLSPNYGILIVARMIMGIGAGLAIVTVLIISTKIAPPGKRASAIAIITMGLTSSLIIGVPIGRIMTNAFGWQSIFGGIALLGLIAMVVIYLTIPDIEGDKPVSLLQQLALFKKRKVILGLSITLFWLGGYSIAYTYLSPYLLNVSGISDKFLSTALLVFGIASLIGSKFGGFSTDRWGIPFTLTSTMTLHIVMLILLSLLTNSVVGVMIVLIIWSFSAWATAPTQQYLLATIEPESSAILLGLNQSIMQLAMAAGAGIGGIAVGSVSLAAVTWFGALGVAIAIAITLILSSSLSKKEAQDNSLKNANT
ncbi:MFS transporter [Cytobacillus solani]|uniref:MFS transporter n=1 Tax=Cytobacillus solani TaxID=1637975 RepID=A0A0Q3SN07_9BACI|nr:MFS transporter [Cytobacillus solani]KOP84111.1 MFS transporter [Bacillus sp. FJAT-21945]KQL20996.1 MFS transporter [Cytobacillus solani]USK54233.1 MFS transporter [Cytobacillus solani]